jgi:hypothetical protein
MTKTSCALLISVCLIFGILVAGCSSQAPVTTTPVPTPAAPQPKYVAGDIIAKSATSTDKSLYLILDYDKKSDEYTRAWIYKNSDGSWGHRIDNLTSKTTRTIIEKTYPAKAGHVSVAAIPIVTPTIVVTAKPTSSGAAPVVANITPALAGVGTTVTLTITGNNFQNGDTVKLIRGGGGLVIGTALSISSSSITGTFNLGGLEEGQYNVVVSDTNGQSDTLVGGFTIGAAPPIISSVYPNSGSLKDNLALTINGQNFADPAKVSLSMGSLTFDQTYISNVMTISPTQITCNIQIPASTTLGDWNVKVTNIASQESGTWTQTFHITNSTAT